MTEKPLPPNVPLYKRVKMNGKWTMRAIGFYSPHRDLIVLKDKSVFFRRKPGFVNKARGRGEEE